MYTKNYFAGTTAILYNFELTGDIDVQRGESYSTWQSRTGITEMGIKYRKSTDSVSQTLVLPHPMSLSGFNFRKTLLEFEEGDILYGVPWMSNNIYYVPKRIIPIKVVLRNLTPTTTYTVYSYYIKEGHQTSFNIFNITTMAKGDVTYNCTNIIGGSDNTRTKLSTSITTACTIYNSVTAFRRAASTYTSISHNDYLNSSSGGSFVAYLDDSLTGWAESSMHFLDAPLYVSLKIVMHEMAHNLMYPMVDFTPGTEAYTKMQTFMEFATGSEGATWKWLSGHNYPVISNQLRDLKIDSYLVAAACWVCRDAGGYV